MKGGTGLTNVTQGGVTMDAMAACNTLSEMVNPGRDTPLTGTRMPCGTRLRHKAQSVRYAQGITIAQDLYLPCDAQFSR